MLSHTHGQRIGLALLAFALVFGMSLPRANAQLTTGTVFGIVQDSQGATIAGATVSLISESRGTRLPDVASNATGEFVIPNVPPDTYTVEIAQKGFKTVRRTGIAVSPGDRTGLGALVLDVGALTETVTVTADAQLLQTQSAERSFTITRTEVQNLPMSARNFTALIAILPGVAGTLTQPQRMGDQTSYSGGNSNIMMDGVSTMDSGNNAVAISVNTEAIAEVKILVSNYQAEYGRNSGLQVSAVTKSGSNQFHGSGFLIMRQSGWNANSKTNILNGVARAYTKQKDIGFTVGGPVGKPGRENKLFFFYSHEFDPRSIAVNASGVQNNRFPTVLERAGDFSQTTDNIGNLFNWIKDPLSSSPCTSTNRAGCFPDSKSPPTASMR
jgi:hypothetical protein